MTRILLAGGTGLVGRLLTTRLLQHDSVFLESLVRTSSLPQEREVDFDTLLVDPAACLTSAADVGVSCLGTTLKAAGSPARFRHVDFDLIVAFARAARLAGASRFVLLSSAGAGGRGLYLSTKGETEAAVKDLGFGQVDIVRPSLLLGARSGKRPGEALAQRIMPVLTPMLRGPIARYAALDADTVAKAMHTLSLRVSPGVHVHHVPEIRGLAGD